MADMYEAAVTVGHANPHQSYGQDSYTLWCNLIGFRFWRTVVFTDTRYLTFHNRYIDCCVNVCYSYCPHASCDPSYSNPIIMHAEVDHVDLR